MSSQPLFTKSSDYAGIRRLRQAPPTCAESQHNPHHAAPSTAVAPQVDEFQEKNFHATINLTQNCQIFGKNALALAWLRRDALPMLHYKRRTITVTIVESWVLSQGDASWAHIDQPLDDHTVDNSATRTVVISSAQCVTTTITTTYVLTPSTVSAKF
ncbi:MAG: hypothetical protein R3C14_20960 [Caldilineaceae bacterium]